MHQKHFTTATMLTLLTVMTYFLPETLPCCEDLKEYWVHQVCLHFQIVMLWSGWGQDVIGFSQTVNTQQFIIKMYCSGIEWWYIALYCVALQVLLNFYFNWQLSLFISYFIWTLRVRHCV